MDSQREDSLKQKELFEKIQTYRLVREDMLEHDEQQVFERQQLMRLQLEMYDNIQVSETETSMSEIVSRRHRRP